MRTLTAFNRVTADGYFSAPDGNLDWAVPDEEVEKGAVDAMPGGDTIVFGRRTYDSFESFWPHALRDPTNAPDPHMPQRVSPAMREMAVWINDATKVVFSRTRKEVTWKNSRLLHELDPRENALRLAEPFLADDEALRKVAFRLAFDQSPRVRFQCALSAGAATQ